MTLPGVRRLLYRGARLAGDLQAVRRGRVPQRAYNRVVGRLAARGLRRVFR